MRKPYMASNYGRGVQNLGAVIFGNMLHFERKFS